MIPTTKAAKPFFLKYVTTGLGFAIIANHLNCMSKVTNYRHFLNDMRGDCQKIMPDRTYCPTFYTTMLMRWQIGQPIPIKSETRDRNCEINEVARKKLEDSIYFWSKFTICPGWFTKDVEWMNSQIKSKYIDV